MLRMKLHRFSFRGDMQLNVQRQGYVQRKIVSAEDVKKIVAVPSLGRVPYSGACLDYTQSGAKTYGTCVRGWNISLVCMYASRVSGTLTHYLIEFNLTPWYIHPRPST